MARDNREPKNKFHRVSLEWVINLLRNIYRLKIKRTTQLFPMLPSYNITHICNLKCSYCGYIHQKFEEVDTATVLEIISRIRPHNPALNITGGEPLTRDDIVEIMKEVRRMGFAPVVLNTNSLLLPEKEEVLKYVDYIIVSLDSLNEEHWDKVLGVDGATREVKKIVAHYATRQEEFKFELNVNCVITPDTLEDVPRVLDFCEQVGASFSPAPQIDGTLPNVVLKESDKYRRLIKDLISFKKDKRPIISTILFLEDILDFLPHKCYPTLVPKILPNGDVFYPCIKLKRIIGNLLEAPSLHYLMQEAFRKYPMPECDKGCHMTCYMEPTNYLEYPANMILEHHLRMRNRLPVEMLPTEEDLSCFFADPEGIFFEKGGYDPNDLIRPEKG